jgi:hypothetical protein
MNSSGQVLDNNEGQTENIKELIQEGYTASESVEIIEHWIEDKNHRFDNFWAATEHVINECNLEVPDERRHGTVNCIAPSFCSIRDLHSRATIKMNELFPNNTNNHVPSPEWLR